ncbi:protein eyes shut homolog [Mytilus trossulus]|uniref:protein eyes shut homolog n=1 Tax=Mytilus trossulus TaxID=6551 RepID=UPI00300538F8
MSTVNLSVSVNSIGDEESKHNDVVYMECVDAESQYAAYVEMPANAEETSNIDVVYSECFDAEGHSANIEMFPDAKETKYIDVVYTECVDADGQIAYEEMSSAANTNPEYTELNIAHNSRDNQSINTNNSQTIHVQFRLLVFFISCFLITLIVTNVVTFITTKNKFSAIKQPLTPCTGRNCLNGGSCEVWNGMFHCSCKSGFSGRLCRVTPCTGRNCLNGGSCEVVNGMFQCLCKPGFSGNLCGG